MALAIKGVSYTTEGIPADAVRRDLRTIRDDLHCTTVMLRGTAEEGLIGAARHALEIGLDVWLQSHTDDRPHKETLAHIGAMAAAAEELRVVYPGRVTLVVGCEFSLFAPGIVPGPATFLRLQVILRWRRLFDRRITRRLNALLAAACATARASFRGPVTYGAAFWEDVDWSGFDIVGVNLYRLGTDTAEYAGRVRALVRGAGKPVAVTEFGCGSYFGAEKAGPGAFRIVNWFADPPRVTPGHVRDERTQARYVGELIDLYESSGVHGCFVFTYAMPDFPHHEIPAHDLDMAGFGIVKVPSDDPERRTPKEAFHTVAAAYR
ncbi:hypothetical protein CLV63_12364 [Murinocardiopsis flavida]|uniref:Abortive infection protein n=1 Tax=Murinocardiopsis flavida TaxID=645275 RepID=A0A2P8CZ27_9ACTN|nr:hypothetical protein [Murinocardiopsis flavida]PSK90235.1 hypothetical protein CLV63_12364 [Murinocardiopsis flavida]